MLPLVPRIALLVYPLIGGYDAIASSDFRLGATAAAATAIKTVVSHPPTEQTSYSFDGTAHRDVTDLVKEVESRRLAETHTDLIQTGERLEDKSVGRGQTSPRATYIRQPLPYA